MMNFSLQRYAFLALLAAALFGASTPLAKLLLGQMPPLVLAGLLYLGSGAGLLAVKLARNYFSSAGRASNKEAPLRGRDYFWLASATLTGGILAPVLLLWGLAGTSATGASLLLNLEGVMTTLIAALFFREAVARRVWLASLIMLSAGLLLAYQPDAVLLFSPRACAVVGACLLWGLDNNLTRKISAGDPMFITMTKGWSAGGVSLALAFATGAAWPSAPSVLGAMSLGLFSYGISLVLFVYALRHLGSARTAAHFSTAPFIGAGVSVLLLGEPLTMTLVAALGLMIAATYLVLSERHEHTHTHEYLVHEHLHTHDAHHRHAHHGTHDAEPHSHVHSHEPITHRHAHMPDIHHRHRH